MHLLEHLLADHALHSHLLQQKQRLVVHQSHVRAPRGRSFENPQWLLLFPVT